MTEMTANVFNNFTYFCMLQLSVFQIPLYTMFLLKGSYMTGGLSLQWSHIEYTGGFYISVVYVLVIFLRRQCMQYI